jgi:hypothetical protein
MSVQPVDLLELSKQLMTLESGQNECVRRCVVSRAYYAALHAVDLTFPQAAGGARIDGESSHAQIIGRAVARGNQVAAGRTSARMIANMMPRLRRFRNAADYRISENIDNREYLDVVARAQKVLELCNDFCAANTAHASSSVVNSEANKPQSDLTETAAPRPSLKRIK